MFSYCKKVDRKYKHKDLPRINDLVNQVKKSQIFLTCNSHKYLCKFVVFRRQHAARFQISPTRN